KSTCASSSSGSRLHLRLYLVLRQLLLDLPDDVPLRRPRQTDRRRHPHPLLSLSRALSCVVWDANCCIPQTLWSSGRSPVGAICLGRRGTRPSPHHRPAMGFTRHSPEIGRAHV